MGKQFADEAEKLCYLKRKVKALHDSGVPYSEIMRLFVEAVGTYPEGSFWEEEVAAGDEAATEGCWAALWETLRK
jgi:hypothetical protein